MSKKKVRIKLLFVKGHELREKSIQTQGRERALEILFSLRKNPDAQMVGIMDEAGRRSYVGNIVPLEKVRELNSSSTMSVWDHLIVSRLKYHVETDPTKHVVQVNAKDPIYVLIGKGDVVMDPLMNQIFPPVVPLRQEQERT